jgi:hypothetical protein
MPNTPSLLHTALTRANGPIDAEHFAYLIVLATSDENLDAKQEQAEHDYLLILLIHEIRHRQGEERSFENVYELLNGGDVSEIEKILKISEFWKNADDELRTKAVLGVKARLLQVLLADDPHFVG